MSLADLEAEYAESLENDAATEAQKQQDARQLANRIISSEIGETGLANYQRKIYELNEALESDLLNTLELISLDLAKSKDDRKAQEDAFINSLLDRLKTPALYSMLENRNLIGVGGSFSSGKSSFLNCMFFEDGSNADDAQDSLTLPEDQNPSTSVLSFLVKSKQQRSQNEAIVINNHGAQVTIKSHELTAISHSFTDDFGINLANFISFINIPVSSSLLPNNIVFVDTPGYTKAQGQQEINESDRDKAYNQLRSVDYLIWIFDVQNGTIDSKSLEFIKQLAPRNKVLCIANKCDLWPDDKVASVVKSAKDNFSRELTAANIKLFDVVPFSAYKPENYPRSYDRIIDFLKEASNNTSNSTSLVTQLQQHIETVDQLLSEAIEIYSHNNQQLREKFSGTNQILKLKALLEVLRVQGDKLSILKRKRNTLRQERSVKVLQELLNAYA